MIPKIIHQIWVGPKPAPTKWMETWKELHPEYEYRLWDNHVIKSHKWMPAVYALKEYYRSLGKWHGVADVCRYQIMYEFGGFYAPADSVALRPIDPLLDCEMFTVYTNEKHRPGDIAPIIGTVPDTYFLYYVLGRLEDVRWMEKLSTPVESVGNRFWTRCINEHLPDITILPSHTFIPNWKGKERYEGDWDEVYADHMWGTTLDAY